ncbi:MAG TPA: hypothetical protein VE980_02670, partial [Pyrinomonadaceae bacterium]|nr:hypothetical protein [Pyrinomonadaceae bacterium]
MRHLILTIRLLFCWSTCVLAQTEMLKQLLALPAAAPGRHSCHKGCLALRKERGRRVFSRKFAAGKLGEVTMIESAVTVARSTSPTKANYSPYLYKASKSLRRREVTLNSPEVRVI